jgi:hypothetical protein
LIWWPTKWIVWASSSEMWNACSHTCSAAQEAFRVGDVAAASQTMNGLASLVDQIHGEVDLLVSELPPPNASA